MASDSETSCSTSNGTEFLNLMDSEDSYAYTSSRQSSIDLQNLFDENINIQPYLRQYQISYIDNPSDDSDFQDTSYEADVQYEKEKLQRKQEEILETEEIDKMRSKIFKTYLNNHKNKMNSIFNLRGMRFISFNNKFISFIFSPCAFSKRYISVHRKYNVSLIFRKNWWNLRRFQVPNKSEILSFFQSYIPDEKLMRILTNIYDSLVKVTKQQISARKEKHKQYLNGEDVEFNSDDERLLLTPEERKFRKLKINKILNGMLAPTDNPILDISYISSNISSNISTSVITST